MFCKFLGAERTRKETALILNASHVDDVRAAQRRLGEDHESTRTKGTGVTNLPPQAAMLGTGAIVKRPRVIVDELGNESIGIRSISYLPLTYDHRLIDGADAGRFLTTIKRRLEDAAFEADLGL